MTEQEAIDFLEQQNAEGASLTWESRFELSLSVVAGDIIRTEPAFGEFVAPDEHVILYVSSGSFSARWVTLAFHEAALQPVGAPVLYVFLDFDGDPVYLNHSNVTFQWDNHDWLGAGELGAIDFPDETSDLTAQPLKLTLTGVDSAYLAHARESVYKGRTVVVYVAMHDPETLALLGTPEEFWRGFMDVMTLEADKGVGSITLTCEHWLRIAPAVTRYTNEDQQVLFSGDKFFEHLKTVGDRGKWGGKDLGFGGNGGGGAGGTPRFDPGPGRHL